MNAPQKVNTASRKAAEGPWKGSAMILKTAVAERRKVCGRVPQKAFCGGSNFATNFRGRCPRSECRSSVWRKRLRGSRCKTRIVKGESMQPQICKRVFETTQLETQQEVAADNAINNLCQQQSPRPPPSATKTTTIAIYSKNSSSNSSNHSNADNNQSKNFQSGPYAIAPVRDSVKFEMHGLTRYLNA